MASWSCSNRLFHYGQGYCHYYVSCRIFAWTCKNAHRSIQKLRERCLLSRPCDINNRASMKALTRTPGECKLSNRHGPERQKRYSIQASHNRGTTAATLQFAAASYEYGIFYSCSASIPRSDNLLFDGDKAARAMRCCNVP
jgi:hypothetical protein